jgi:5-(carboxyamino)imidazole ribonucleotide synthase
VAQIGLPAVMKTRTLGYDGKGQKVLRTADDVAGAFAELGSVPCLLEGFVPFTGEVSLVTVRGRDGETRCYPLVHNTHVDGILRLSIASTAHPLQALAEDYARRVLEKLDYVGVLAFEFFEVDGGLKANEIAPRVHNSGHWTIEGAECSQFENHLRAVAGLPLGSTAKVGESAMVNFIGEVPPVAQVSAIADCHLHHYGKAFKAGRKVGHATVRSADMASLRARVAEVEALLRG